MPLTTLTTHHQATQASLLFLGCISQTRPDTSYSLHPEYSKSAWFCLSHIIDVGALMLTSPKSLPWARSPQACNHHYLSFLSCTDSLFTTKRYLFVSGLVPSSDCKLQENRDISLFTAGPLHLEHDQIRVDTHLRFGGTQNEWANAWQQKASKAMEGRKAI